MQEITLKETTNVILKIQILLMQKEMKKQSILTVSNPATHEWLLLENNICKWAEVYNYDFMLNINRNARISPFLTLYF